MSQPSLPANRASGPATRTTGETIARLIEPSGRAHELGLGLFVIGREADADVALAHPDVSRHHAELTISSEGATIRDLGSKNGVAIDGRKLELGQLRHGARVNLGELELMFEHHADRIDQLILRSGELTVRRPVERPPAEDHRAPATSLLVPGLAALVFALLLAGLLVFG